MDWLLNSWINSLKDKESVWTWQELALMQWCVNKALFSPETQQWCSLIHTAPPELPQPDQLCLGLGVKHAASGLAHFCLTDYELSQHPGNEHPRNCRAETLSGQKNYLGLSLSRVFNLQCAMELWRVSKQNTEEGTGCLFLSQHSWVLLPVHFPDGSNFHPVECRSKRWTMASGSTLVLRLATRKDLFAKEATTQSGCHKFEDSRCWTWLLRKWASAPYLYVLTFPTIVCKQMSPSELAADSQHCLWR